MHPVARKHLNTFLAMWLTVGSIVHVECQNAELISQRCTTRIVGYGGDAMCEPQMCAVRRVQPSE